MTIISDAISPSPEPQAARRQAVVVRRYFATAPRGIEPLLAEELSALGARSVRPVAAGVELRGTLELAYRSCLWSRLASRILLPLSRFPAPDAEALYDGMRAIDWDEHLAPDGTLAIDCTSTAAAIPHSHYAALKAKDAICDRFRERYGIRPSVSLIRPRLRVNLHLRGSEAVVSLDLSGEALHRRGYRGQGLLAPLKENLAAAILCLAGWPQYARSGAPLVDPMCGSGTLVIEAAGIAADSAPGLKRSYFGFLGWRGHDAELWARLLEEATRRHSEGLGRVPPILGYDRDPRAVAVARANVERAGLGGPVQLEVRELACVRPPEGRAGLIVMNPPYGERLGRDDALPRLYAEIGEVLKREFRDWDAALLTGNKALAHRLRLQPERSLRLYNGAIACRLLLFSARGGGNERGAAPSVPRDTLARPRQAVTSEPGTEALEFANRLRKNLRTLGRWARRTGVDGYRLYDADLPQFALAVDLYRADVLWVHVQEYAPPLTVDREAAARRLQEALGVLHEVLGVGAERMVLKVRAPQRGAQQYQKIDGTGQAITMREGACRFLVNLSDYLDTGLFLDERAIRAMIGELSPGKRFLNLFAYTATATVCAALGGARSSVSVDLSRTYLEWARRNLALNGIDEARHELIQADCLEWLRAQRKRPSAEPFDLIFLAPPTFSNSKRMATSLDIQRDHVRLIMDSADLLHPEGLLIFSTNRRRFMLDREALRAFHIEDLTAATIPPDFARSPHIHRCWRIRRAAARSREPLREGLHGA